MAEKQAGIRTTVKTRKLPFALQLGFFAGFIWGLIRMLFYHLQFTETPVGFLLLPFMDENFLAGFGGSLIGLLSFILLSIIAAILYTYTLRKLLGPWIGLVYGLAWFGAVYLLAGPFLGAVEPIGVITLNSLWTDGCVFVLWGIFIGYTVSFEFTDERLREASEGNLNLQ